MKRQKLILTVCLNVFFCDKLPAMNLSLLVFNQVTIMLILMGLGYYAYKLKFLSPQGSKDMSAILMYLVTPAVILQSFSIERTAEKTAALLTAIPYALILAVVGIVLAYIFQRKNPSLNFAVAFPNTGFIGIPVVYGVLGSEAVFYMLPLVMIFLILSWTYGVFVLTQNRHHLQLKNIVRNPIVLFELIGFLLYFSQFKLPSLLTQTLNLLTPLNSSLPMFVIGAMLADIPFRSMFGDIKVYWATLQRLVLIPLVVAIILVTLPGNSTNIHLMKTALFIGVATPSGAFTVLLAKLHGVDTTQGVKIVSLSTLASVISIPLLVFIFEYLIAQ